MQPKAFVSTPRLCPSDLGGKHGVQGLPQRVEFSILPPTLSLILKRVDIDR